MTLRITSMIACLALAAPAIVLAQATSPEEDRPVNLEAIDAMLGDSIVAEQEDETTDAAEETGIPDGDADGPEPDQDTEDETSEEGTEDGEAEDEAELSDLTRAFNEYSNCASEAGAVLEGQGFALDQIGTETLLQCSGPRAAYINAFYFSLLPGYPEATEAEVRDTAEHLVTQTDAALMNIVAAEVRELRNARPEEPEADDSIGSEPSEEETEPDA